MFNQETVYIDSLRVRGLGRDTPELRLTLSRLLQAAALPPPSLSPSGWLIVRQMADPLPGQMKNERQTRRRGKRWEHAVRESLDDLYCQAAWPARGDAPAHAVAVAFVDEAEMLACLARDLVQGKAARRWWWQVILHRSASSPETALPAVLARRVFYLPAALHTLSAWGQAVAVVRALTPAEALQLCTRMVQAHGLDCSMLEPLLPDERPSREGAEANLETASPDHPQAPVGRQDGRHENDRSRLRDRSPPISDPPWQPWLPPGTVPPGLAPQQALLLGVGLTIQRQPAAARSPTFRRALRRWWARASEPFTRESADMEYDAAKTAAAQRPVSRDPDGSHVESPLSERPVDGETSPDRLETHPRAATLYRTEILKETSALSETQPPGPKTGDKSSSKEEHELLEAAGESQVVSSREPATDPVAGHRERPRDAEEIEQQTGPGIKQVEHADPAVEPAAELWPRQGAVTDLAGVLYLINLMRRLDLPHCFEASRGLAGQVGSWGTLDLLARALIDPANDCLIEDPLWSALAELAGRRPGTMPGAGFHGQDAFALPPAWLKSPGRRTAESCFWAANGRRLVLWSSLGFLLLDRPLDAAGGAAVDQLRRALRENKSGRCLPRQVPERRPYEQAPIDPLTGPLLSDLNSDLAWWLARVTPFIRFCLCRALDVPAADLGPVLLLYRGRLFVTPTHVDVVMDLNDISVPARTAGLDFHPGWLPDFGRIVMFHFE